jgi:hypothetical protein
MTLSEFKAWFEGFTESMDGPPSLKQWERIQARVKEISGVAVSHPVFVDRYISTPNPYRYLVGMPYNGLATTQGAAQATLNAGSCQSAAGVGNNAFAARTRPMDASDTVAFDSHSAMNALGKADAEALKAA